MGPECVDVHLGTLARLRMASTAGEPGREGAKLLSNESFHWSVDGQPAH